MAFAEVGAEGVADMGVAEESQAKGAHLAGVLLACSL